MPVIGVTGALDIPRDVPGHWEDPPQITCHPSSSVPDSSPEPLQMLSATSVLTSAPTTTTSSAWALTYFKQGQPGLVFLLPTSAPLHHGHPMDLGCGRLQTTAWCPPAHDLEGYGNYHHRVNLWWVDRAQDKSFHLSPFPCPVTVDKASQRSVPPSLDPWSLRIWFLVALGCCLTPSHPLLVFPPSLPHSLSCLLPTL